MTKGKWLGKLQDPTLWRSKVGFGRAIFREIQPDGGSWYVMCSWKISCSLLKKCESAPTRSPKFSFCLKVKWVLLDGMGFKQMDTNGGLEDAISLESKCVVKRSQDLMLWALEHPQQSASHRLSSSFIGLAASVHALIQFPVQDLHAKSECLG